MTTADMDLAERLARRRARIAIAFAIVLLVTNPSRGPGEMVRMFDKVSLGIWVASLLILLTYFACGGAFLRGPQVRALMNDDSTLEHRRRGMVSGFWAAIFVAGALCASSLFNPIGGAEAARVVLTLSVATALLRFGMLEHRSLQNG